MEKRKKEIMKVSKLLSNKREPREIIIDHMVLLALSLRKRCV